MSMTLVPLALHVEAVCERRLTASPELALTVGTNGDAPRERLAIAGKVMLWESSAAVTENMTVTGEAAA
jgi:hypothetical protein